MTRGYREFEFDLPGALLDHLVRALDELEQAPLDAINLSGVPEAQGVYQLFLDGQLVYIGKTDAESGLFRRLTRHSTKVNHRSGLDPARVSFKAIRIFVFTAMDLETQLIKHYTAGDGTRWNGSGFGSNDPGRNRDNSTPGTFDREFPIDIDYLLDADFSGTKSAAAVANQLKALLPYTFRFQTHPPRSRTPHPDLANTEVTMPHGQMTARRVIEELVRQLPPGWQATALSAVLILYREQVDTYPQATILVRS
ncbi:MAG: GIY-YIG nuclease family protein [Pseudochelatococcus sp.]|jgi:hypothetical protein|uniref:GIY-YIG nuclease family protein n=1 Tax=Pseudochelatococcus sp. TaxID=2020869 RepID=UPI003D9419EE